MDERSKCWAAAIRFRDALEDLSDNLSAAGALYAGSSPPVPSMSRPVVTIGGSIEDVRDQYRANYEALVRAREDARACGVPDGVFEFIDKLAAPDNLREFPANSAEISTKENTVLEIGAELNEFGDDLYHERPKKA